MPEGRHSQTIGTRAQVWHGTAKKTSGGLTKSDLMQNKAGRIVSRAKHNTAKKEMRLLKHGYGTKKGEFGFVKIGSRKHSRKHRSRKMRGGMGIGPLTPANVNADYMIKDVVPQVFSPLDRALVGGTSRKMLNGGKMMKAGKKMMNGGYYGNGFSPAQAMAMGIDGQGITDYGAGSNNVQFAAGQAGGRRRKKRGGFSTSSIYPDTFPTQITIGNQSPLSSL
jgi:hypothetical protein